MCRLPKRNGTRKRSDSFPQKSDRADPSLSLTLSNRTKLVSFPQTSRSCWKATGCVSEGPRISRIRVVCVKFCKFDQAYELSFSFEGSPDKTANQAKGRREWVQPRLVGGGLQRSGPERSTMRSDGASMLRRPFPVHATIESYPPGGRPPGGGAG